jgi:hypothetical protein
LPGGVMKVPGVPGLLRGCHEGPRGARISWGRHEGPRGVKITTGRHVGPMGC